MQFPLKTSVHVLFLDYFFVLIKKAVSFVRRHIEYLGFNPSSVTFRLGRVNLLQLDGPSRF